MNKPTPRPSLGATRCEAPLSPMSAVDSAMLSQAEYIKEITEQVGALRTKMHPVIHPSPNAAADDAKPDSASPLVERIRGHNITLEMLLHNLRDLTNTVQL